MAEVPGCEDSPLNGPDVDLRPHPLVTKLLGDADPPRDIVELVGYFGASKLPGSVRLYSSLDFRTYLEIPKVGIALTEPGDPAYPDAPTKAFVAADAKLELVHVSSQSVEASFLRGGIASAYLGPAVGDEPEPATYPDGRDLGSRHCFGGYGGPAPPGSGPIILGVPTSQFHTAPTRTRPPCCP